MHAESVTYYNPHCRKYHSGRNTVFSIRWYWLVVLWNHYVLRKRMYKIMPWISMSWGRIEHSNWGDDINIFFLQKITHDCLIPGFAYANPHIITFKQLPGTPIVYTIGSIFHYIIHPNAIVWGAGLLNESMLPSVRPATIAAVRGPLTRKVLLANGYDCPAVYGDPALLLPYYYFPKKIRKKYKLGIIPHYVDEDKEELNKYASCDSVRIIHMTGYANWKSVIDQVLSCEFVASSSLHGLIIAEAYRIPNLWVEIKEPLVGEVSRRFKFHDFFQSIGLDRDAPYSITAQTTLSDLCEQKQYYQAAPGLDLRPLVNACPFQLKEDIIKRLYE